MTAHHDIPAHGDDLLRTDHPRSPRLFSGFLAISKRTNSRRKSLGFALDLAVLVPDYEIDNSWWLDDHYEGGYLFRDKINLEVTPHADGTWSLRYGLDSKSPNRTSRRVEREELDGSIEFRIPLASKTGPGMKATLVIACTPWNADAVDEE